MKAVSPEGSRIIGSLDSLEGTARADVDVINGNLKLEYTGETEVDWDSQKTKTDKSERLFVCAQRKVWRESQIIQATQSSGSKA